MGIGNGFQLPNWRAIFEYTVEVIRSWWHLIVVTIKHCAKG